MKLLNDCNEPGLDIFDDEGAFFIVSKVLNSFSKFVYISISSGRKALIVESVSIFILVVFIASIKRLSFGNTASSALANKADASCLNIDGDGLVIATISLNVVTCVNSLNKPSLPLISKYLSKSS